MPSLAPAFSPKQSSQNPHRAFWAVLVQGAGKKPVKRCLPQIFLLASKALIALVMPAPAALLSPQPTTFTHFPGSRSL
jgi:hypothetical protein